MGWNGNRVAMHVVAALAVGAAALLIADPGPAARADEPDAVDGAAEGEGRAPAADEPTAAPTRSSESAACVRTEIEAGRWWTATDDAEPELEPRAGLPCRLPIPSASRGPVRVTHAGTKAERAAIERVASCAKDRGFVVESETEARLCPETCDGLQGEPQARIVVTRGCAAR